MQRHIIDHPRDRNPAQRLAEFLRRDRAQRRILLRADRHRGAARLVQFLRIARERAG